MSAGRWVRRVRIGAAVLWLLAALPLWFALSIACEDHFGDRGFVHVALITEQTCAELAKTDPIFADLPDGVAVTAVYLRQMPGEAEATVSLTADDPEAFAQVVRRFLSCEDREAMGERGRAYYDAHFTKRDHMDRLEALLTSLAGGK